MTGYLRRGWPHLGDVSAAVTYVDTVAKRAGTPRLGPPLDRDSAHKGPKYPNGGTECFGTCSFSGCIGLRLLPRSLMDVLLLVFDAILIPVLLRALGQQYRMRSVSDSSRRTGSQPDHDRKVALGEAVGSSRI